MKKFISVIGLVLAVAGSNLSLAESLEDMGLEKVKDSRYSVGYVKPGHDFDRYDSIVLVDIAADRGIRHLVIHAILDGRDTAPKSALQSIMRLEEHLKQHQPPIPKTYQALSHLCIFTYLIAYPIRLNRKFRTLYRRAARNLPTSDSELLKLWLGLISISDIEWVKREDPLLDS